MAKPKKATSKHWTVYLSGFPELWGVFCKRGQNCCVEHRCQTPAGKESDRCTVPDVLRVDCRGDTRGIPASTRTELFYARTERDYPWKQIKINNFMALHLNHTFLSYSIVLPTPTRIHMHQPNLSQIYCFRPPHRCHETQKQNLTVVFLPATINLPTKLPHTLRSRNPQPLSR